MKSLKSKLLGKKVMLSLLAAGVMSVGVAGSAFAETVSGRVKVIDDTYEKTGDSFVLQVNDNSQAIWGQNGAKIDLLNTSISISIDTANNPWAVYVGRAKNNKQSIVNIGNSSTESIYIGSKGIDGVYGLVMLGAADNPIDGDGDQLNVTGKNVTVDVSGSGDVRAIHVGNNSTEATENKRSTLNLKADNIVLNAKSEDKNAMGIVAMSQGIVNVEGNIAVTADTAIVARGEATININVDDAHTTKLKGDIEFNYNNATSRTGIDSYVDIHFVGAESSFNGRVQKESDVKPIPEGKSDVTHFSMTFADGATWTNTGASFVNTLTMKGGIVNFVNDKDEDIIEIDTLNGSGATFNMNNSNTVRIGKLDNDDITLNSGMMVLTGSDNKITGKVTLNKGADIDTKGNNLTLAAGSKLTIDNLNNYLKEYNGVDTYAVISAGAGTVTAEKGAKISIGTAAEGTYKIVEAANVVNNMTDEDVTFDGGLKTGTWSNSDKEMNLKVAIKNLEEETQLVPTENAGLVEAALKNINKLNNNPNTQQLGDFFNKISALAELANSSNSDSAKADIKAALSSSAQGGMNNGAASTATSIVNNVAGLTSGHMSIAAPAPQGGNGVGLFEENSGAGVWAQYLHGKDKADEMPSGSSKNKYSNSYNGILVGADFKQVNKFQSGVAFSYTDGSGSSSSTTDGVLGSTGHTEFKSYGFTYYGAIKNDTVNTMFDLGYNHSKADSDTNILLTGHKDSSTSKTHTWTAGVTVEKSFTDGKNGAQFIPYAGVRYMNISTDDFTTKMGYHNSMDDQNVFMIPVGVKFRQENTYKSGWRVTPKADLSYVWAVGDTDNDVNVTISGLPNGTSKIGYTVMDKGSFLGTVGVEASKNNWTYGVSYSYQKGEHQRSDKYFVDVKYSF